MVDASVDVGTEEIASEDTLDASIAKMFGVICLLDVVDVVVGATPLSGIGASGALLLTYLHTYTHMPLLLTYLHTYLEDQCFAGLIQQYSGK